MVMAVRHTASTNWGYAMFCGGREGTWEGGTGHRQACGGRGSAAEHPVHPERRDREEGIGKEHSGPQAKPADLDVALYAVHEVDAPEDLLQAGRLDERWDDLRGEMRHAAAACLPSLKMLARSCTAAAACFAPRAHHCSAPAY